MFPSQWCGMGTSCVARQVLDVSLVSSLRSLIAHSVGECGANSNIIPGEEGGGGRRRTTEDPEAGKLAIQSHGCENLSISIHTFILRLTIAQGRVNTLLSAIHTLSSCRSSPWSLVFVVRPRLLMGKKRKNC